jgi:hypothetical protein
MVGGEPMTEGLQAIENRLEVLGKKVEHGLRENRRLRKENEEVNFHLKQLHYEKSLESSLCQLVPSVFVL